MKIKNKTYLIILLVVVALFLLFVYGLSAKEYYENYVNNNLIENGSFEGGKDITQKIKAEGDNQIIILPNPGKSSHVLKQSHVKERMNYYLLRIPVEPNETYLLSFWYACENGSDLEQTLLKLEIKDKNHRNHVLSGQTKITEKAKVDGKEWNNVDFTFRVPADILNQTLYVYIGYNMVSGTRYYTDISLKKYLTEAPKFSVTDGLQVFLEGATLDPSEHLHNNLWKDISEKGHDFIWEGKPKYDPEGFYRTYGNSLQGPSGRDLMSNNIFTIGINMALDEKLDNTSVKKGDEKAMENYREILQIPGNNKFGLRVYLPIYYGKIILDIGDERYETSRQVMTNNNNKYFFIYDGSTFHVYLNNSLMTTLVPKNKIHFNNNPIVLNENRDLKAKLFNLIIYDRAIGENEITKVVKYMTQGEKGLRNKVERWKKSCKMDPSCNENMENINNNNNNNNNSNNNSNNSNNNNSNEKCPNVVLKDDEYYVHVPKGSQIEKEVGYCGYKSYGKHQANARKMFKLNFPDCQIPNILVEPRRHQNFNKCPYVIRDGNPCFSESCANVDWSLKDPENANLAEGCKRNINHYCERYSKYDPACFCWKRENRDNKECVKFRRKFLNPGDFNCQIRNFKIEQHPDIKDYVRKDKIPCWGCNLASNGQDKNSGIKVKPPPENNLNRNWNNAPFE